MIGLIKNELIKIFKRKNIYILLTIGILAILVFNLFQRIQNCHVNMEEQYERLYANDKILLENYNTLKIKDSYQDIIERIELEKYAIENNITYNIITNSQNENIQLPKDARYLLVKVFDNFDIIIIILIIYLSSTMISEEYNTTQAIEKIKAEIPMNEYIEKMIEFIQTSKRGVLLKSHKSGHESVED